MYTTAVVISLKSSAKNVTVRHRMGEHCVYGDGGDGGG
jgi:hypothetical protein